MPHNRLIHHLRSYRKVSGLSQDDVGYLLGWRRGPRVSLHEQFRELPTLKTAIAYEIIFDTPFRFLFPGLHARIRENVCMRARALAERTTARQKAKLAVLRGLAAVPTPDVREA